MTPRATSHLNDRLSELRMFTGGLELYLRNRRDHIKLEDVSGTPHLRSELNYLKKTFGPNGKGESKGEDSTSGEKPLLPIVNEEWVTEQEFDTDAIYQQLKEEEQGDPISSYFNATGEFQQKIVLAAHYDYLEYQLKQENWYENDEVKANQVRENIRRARLLLLILHGHAYQQLARTEQEHLGASEDFKRIFLTDIYAFPSDPRLEMKLLTQLVNSRVLLQKTRGKLQSQYLRLVGT